MLERNENISMDIAKLEKIEWNGFIKKIMRVATTEDGISKRLKLFGYVQKMALYLHQLEGGRTLRWNNNEKNSRPKLSC